jgi:preprotein translocase subunit YajC
MAANLPFFRFVVAWPRFVSPDRDLCASTRVSPQTSLLTILKETIPMRNFARLIATVSLGAAAAVAAPVIAQDAAATTATATVDLAVGTKVFDSEGAELGTVTATQDANVVVDLGAGKQVTLPSNAFGKLEQGPTIGATKAQVVAAVDQAAAGSDAKLAAALQPGADVRSAHGSAIVGKVKLAEADGVVLTTPSGDVKLPRSAFFVGQAGLATSFTAEQFAAAVAQATAAPAPQPGATAEAENATPDTPAN